MTKNFTAVTFAILAAALYAGSIPFAKQLLGYMDPIMLAALLYLGAGLGMFSLAAFSTLAGKPVVKEPLTRTELPWVAAMVILDIAAPVMLLLGLRLSTSAGASLLNNFEIVATSLIAFMLFRELISRRLLAAIVLVTAASMLLGVDFSVGFSLDTGALLVLGATVCWGFENNTTRMLSAKSSVQIVILKGCFSGLGNLLIALAVGESIPFWGWIMAAMMLGFVSYGLSINFYILAQKHLGAAKTSAFYAIAPFLGVGFSLTFLGERPGTQFWLALAIMAVATWFMIKDSIGLQHTHFHEHRHTHEHRHGDLVHCHEHSHFHSHQHAHGVADRAEDSTPHSHEHPPGTFTMHIHDH